MRCFDALEQITVSHTTSQQASRELRVPREWIERRLEQKAPTLSRSHVADLENKCARLRSPEKTLPCALTISYDPNSLERWANECGMSAGELLSAVDNDLRQGVAISETDWKTREGGPKVRVFGAKWQLVVRPQRARKSSRTMAVLDQAKQLNIPTNRSRYTPRSVTFHKIWEETPCKPESWVESYRDAHHEYETLTSQLEQLHEQRKGRFARSARELRRGEADEAVKKRDIIHSKVRRQYLALRVMMELLKLRSDRESHTFNAVVAEPDERRSGEQDDSNLTTNEPDDSDNPNLLRLNLTTSAPSGVLEQDAFVEIRAPSEARPRRTRVQSVSEVNHRPQIDVDLESDTFPVGTNVEMRTVSRFGMWAHQRAVQDLLKENTEGRWPDLANLLCSPAALELSGTVPCERFFCDEDPGRPSLNAQQRAAVVGALATPHAFCVQGPPGTGKTTVICELVEQLVAKGERVLLVAPTHVAVDEVLRRIGSRDGIRALRLSWDDSRVSDDVRKFTPSNIIDPFLERVKKLDTSRSSRWRQEQVAIQDATGLLEQLSKAQQALNQASEQQHQADSVRNDAETALAEERPELTKRLTDLRAAVDNFQRELDSLQQDTVTAEASLETVKSKAGWLEVASGWIGLGAVGKARRNLRRVKKTARKKNREREALIADRKQTEERLQKLVQDAFQAGEHAERMATQVRLVLEDKDQSESACRGHRLISKHALNPSDLKRLVSSLHDQHEQLEAYQDLSPRFDALLAEATEEHQDLSGLRRDLLSVTNLFCCTTTGIAGSPELRDLVFDTLIVDEASRVTDSEFLIGAVRTKRWILVGDEKQLPPYVEQNDEHFIHALSALHQSESQSLSLEDAVENLGKIWEEDEELHRFRRESVLSFAERIHDSGDWQAAYCSAFSEGVKLLRSEVDDPSRALLDAMRNNLVRSLFERVVTQCKPDMKVRLVEQRRMIEPIAAIVSDPVYNGDYRTPSTDDLATCGITPLTTATFPSPITFLDTSMLGIRARDKLVRNSFVNETEARWIAEACRTLDRELTQVGSNPVTVSILTFYKAQARLISEQLFGNRRKSQSSRFSCLRFSVIDSIDKIQGQESDIVFLSFCRTAGRNVSPRFGQWLQDLRRLNVACTRAHRALIFVGQRELLGKLCSNDPAMQFYRHLNDLFDNRSDVMRVVRQFGGSEQ